MLFLSRITILYISYCFRDDMTEKKFVTRDVTNFSSILFDQEENISISSNHNQASR